MALLLLLLIPAGLLATPALLGSGLAALIRSGRRGWLTALAGLLGACAAGFYTWGLLHVAGAVLEAEDGGAWSSPLPPCRTAAAGERVAQVVDYTVSYVPLGFVCETTGGGGYDSGSVPGYVNPAVLSFGPAAVAAMAAGRRAAVNRSAAGPSPS
ncbi:hypothetical protein [Streptomyces erythrochromogenes]|uniref:hypothetical protein n=1 Tax=Streptomyces erythrochromogenes TaxID=285574 RepID=UPI00031EA281